MNIKKISSLGTEIVQFLAMLGNSVLPMGLDSSYEPWKVTSVVFKRYLRAVTQHSVVCGVGRHTTLYVKTDILFYFILSSEIMENISAIKVVWIYSEMIWYHFTVDWYHHSMRELPFSTILGIVVFRKDFACIVLVWHYTTDVFTSYQATDVTLWRHFRVRVALICTRRQSNGSFKRLS